MVVVRFNRWEEFREEIHGASPEDRVVRFTVNLWYKRDRKLHRTFGAEYVARSQLVEFVQ